MRSKLWSYFSLWIFLGVFPVMTVGCGGSTSPKTPAPNIPPAPNPSIVPALSLSTCAVQKLSVAKSNDSQELFFAGSRISRDCNLDSEDFEKQIFSAKEL